MLLYRLLSMAIWFVGILFLWISLLFLSSFLSSLDQFQFLFFVRCFVRSNFLLFFSIKTKIEMLLAANYCPLNVVFWLGLGFFFSSFVVILSAIHYFFLLICSVFFGFFLFLWFFEQRQEAKVVSDNGELLYLLSNQMIEWIVVEKQKRFRFFFLQKLFKFRFSEFNDFNHPCTRTKWSNHHHHSWIP